MNLIDQAKAIPHGVRVISEWLGSGGQVCDAAEAQARANICLDCPHNKPGFSLTAPVALAVKQHLKVKNKLNLRVQGEKRLGVCEICTCQLRLQIWQQIDSLRSELDDAELRQLPAHCWKRP
jgi:hypothetical protein